MSTVLVTDAHRGSAVAIIRSLGQAGHRVVAASADTIVPGFYSRYRAAKVRYPDAALDPDGMVRSLVAAIRRLHVDLVIPVSDDVLLPLAAHREELGGLCTVAMPPAEALRAVVDKKLTVEVARSLGIAVPSTETADDVESAVDRSRDLGLPVVVKPRASYDYEPGRRPVRRWVAYARDEAELRQAVAAAGGKVVLQTYHPGAGRGVSLLVSEGRPLAAFQHRRLREVPLSGGASSYRESEALDPGLLTDACRLLGALRWTGLAMVEFKGDGSDAVLLEVNGRVWGALPLAVAAGMDFPSRLAALLLDGPPPPGTPVAADYRNGIRSRDLELERAWIADVFRGDPRGTIVEMPSRWDAVGVGLRLLSPADGYDVLDRHDPLPGFAEIARVAADVSLRGVRGLRQLVS